MKGPILRLVGIMALIVVAGFMIARSYYSRINRSVDPRVENARRIYARYDEAAASGDFYRILALLDSVDQIYAGENHYRQSFERGVIENNRAAVLLTIALHRDSIPPTSNPYAGTNPDSVISMARQRSLQAIAYYHHFDSLFGKLDRQGIEQLIARDFLAGLSAHDNKAQQEYLDARCAGIEAAIKENPRRLSVCYTNLGLVCRLEGAYEEALSCYEKALEHWDRNLDAENNINRLLDRPLKKRSLINTLFPPDREDD